MKTNGQDCCVWREDRWSGWLCLSEGRWSGWLCLDRRPMVRMVVFGEKTDGQDGCV